MIFNKESLNDIKIIFFYLYLILILPFKVNLLDFMISPQNIYAIEYGVTEI